MDSAPQKPAGLKKTSRHITNSCSIFKKNTMFVGLTGVIERAHLCRKIYIVYPEEGYGSIQNENK
jgi:hypothetical protein